MTVITRRHFGGGALAAAGILAMPGVLRAQGKPRLVVIGGGPAGATVAKYVAKDSQGAIAVTHDRAAGEVHPPASIPTCSSAACAAGSCCKHDYPRQESHMA